jgi:hypothetical protein
MTRDPLAPVRAGSSGGSPVPFSLASILGPPLAGIDFRPEVTVRRPGGPDRVVPFAFTRHGLPWVVWRAVEVEDARELPAGFADDGLTGLLEVASVEAAFAVFIDPTAGWRAVRLELPPRA